MRATVTLLVLACVFKVEATAEVIHLKNGRTIWADHVRESGSHLEYEIGDDSFAISRDLVDHIDAGGPTPTQEAKSSASPDLPIPAPAPAYAGTLDFTDKVVHDGKVDSDALTALEQAGNAAETAAGYLAAGRHEFERGNFARARSYFETAMNFDGNNPTLLNYYASLLVRTGDATQALTFAERAVRNAPDSADALTVLGYVQYSANHTQDAIKTWKHSLELRPDKLVEQYLSRAEHESTAEANYSERESNHFTLRFEGEQTSESFRGELLEALEADYDDLARQLDTTPHDKVAVTLYTNQTFFDVTQAPSWTGAVNDGKLRIPVHGMSTITPELAHVLKHELAHSFINQLSAGRCPQWLNEGLAQALEPRPLANGKVLAEMFRSQRQIPLNALEGSFMSMPPFQAAAAYDESLAAVQYIVDTSGIGDLQRVLKLLSEGSSTEAALRATIHAGYAELELEIGKYLNDKYPN